MLLPSPKSRFGGNFFTVRKGHGNNRVIYKFLLIMVLIFLEENVFNLNYDS